MRTGNSTQFRNIKSDYDQNPTVNTVFCAKGVKRESVMAAMHELLISVVQ